MEINVYYSVNDGKMYQQLVVSLVSLVNNNKDNLLNVYLLGCDIKEYNVKNLSKEQIEVLNELISKYNKENRLFYFDVSDLIYKYLMTLPNLDGVNDLCWKGSKYKRPALLYVRFLIAFLPNIPEKILWLDNDTIICKDLFSLFNIDISEFVWAGAEDPTYHCTRKEYEEKLGKMYLHNGMMLVNMLQADPIFKQIIADYFTTDYRVFGDMNIINEYKRKKLAKSFLSFNPINEIIIFHVCYSCCYHSFLVYMWHKFTSFFSKKYFKGQHFLSSKYGKPHKQIIKTNDLIFYKKNKQLNPLLKSVNEYLTKSNNEIK